MMKYALNLDPHVSGTSGLPFTQLVAVDSQQYLALTFTRVKGATDINYTVEVSGDLHNWYSGPAYTAFVGLVDQRDTETVTWRDNVPMDSAYARFIRLRILP